MPKDNETVPLLAPDGPREPLTPQPFAPDQMVRCDNCLRANPPTRLNCLYCAAVLPVNETTVNLQKPALRPLEKWERGYNNIFLPSPANPPQDISEPELSEAADLLRLTTSDLTRILSLKAPLPLARTATMNEASLVQRRLSGLKINSIIVSDEELGSEETAPFKVRAVELHDASLEAYQTPETPAIRLNWSDLVLLVVGRLIVKRVELKEQKGTRSENRILNASEFFTDESVLDLYVTEKPTPYRIVANSFDFSYLKERKSLLAGENMVALLGLIRDHAPRAEYDDSYNSVRKALDLVWPTVQQDDSRGWRRERPGKYSLGTVSQISNELQFSKYSRLRYFLHSKANENA